MRLCVIDENYMKYLRSHEKRIPYSNYGKNHYKPCFHPLFKNEDLEYVVYITSPKAKHRHMKNQRDFKKVFISTNKRRGHYFVGAINLNHMFPVPVNCIKEVKFKTIDRVRTFKNKKEKRKYISLLKHELKSIQQMQLSKAAKKLYSYKYERANNRIAKRCLDFKNLEKLANKYRNF